MRKGESSRSLFQGLSYDLLTKSKFKKKKWERKVYFKSNIKIQRPNKTEKHESFVLFFILISLLWRAWLNFSAKIYQTLCSGDKTLHNSTGFEHTTWKDKSHTEYFPSYLPDQVLTLRADLVHFSKTDIVTMVYNLLWVHSNHAVITVPLS